MDQSSPKAEVVSSNLAGRASKIGHFCYSAKLATS